MAFGIESKIRKKKAKAKANGAVRGACRLLCEVNKVVRCSSAERGARASYNAWRLPCRHGGAGWRGGSPVEKAEEGAGYVEGAELWWLDMFT